jgi:hypothetical protein
MGCAFSVGTGASTGGNVSHLEQKQMNVEQGYTPSLRDGNVVHIQLRMVSCEVGEQNPGSVMEGLFPNLTDELWEEFRPALADKMEMLYRLVRGIQSWPTTADRACNVSHSNGSS